MELVGPLLPATASLVPIRQNIPTPEDWNTRKALIKRLYLGEDNTLSAVMKTMANEFNFHAT